MHIHSKRHGCRRCRSSRSRTAFTACPGSTLFPSFPPVDSQRNVAANNVRHEAGSQAHNVGHDGIHPLVQADGLRHQLHLPGPKGCQGPAVSRAQAWGVVGGGKGEQGVERRPEKWSADGPGMGAGASSGLQESMRARHSPHARGNVEHRPSGARCTASTHEPGSLKGPPPP